MPQGGRTPPAEVKSDRDPDSDEDEDPRAQTSGRENHRDGGGRSAPKAVKTGLSGLPNLGNTCYLNAALQALVHTPPLADFFVQCEDFIPPRMEGPSKGRAAAQRRLLHSLAGVMRQVWGKGVRTASPHDLLRDTLELNPEYRGLGQQDSQEFLRRTLDVLHEELKEEVAEAESPGQAEGGRRAEGATGGSSAPGGEKGSSDGARQATDQSAANSAGGCNDTSEEGVQEKMGAKEPEKSGSNKAAAHRSIVWDIFRAKVLSEVRCHRCGKVSQTEEMVMDQSVSIPGHKVRSKLAAREAKENRERASASDTRRSHGPSSSGGASPSPGGGAKGTGADDGASCGQSTWLAYLLGIFGAGPVAAVTLHDCLMQYYAPEELVGSEKYKCEHCKELQDSTKKVSLLMPPEVMTLHIKRFRYDTYLGSSMGSKISDHVHFPLHELDMRPFTKPSDTYKEAQEEALYDLLAVVEHRGGLNGGHYVAYVRNSDGGWYECDDTRVSPVSEDAVLRHEGYILFYRRRTPQAKLQERERIAALLRSVASPDARDPSPDSPGARSPGDPPATLDESAQREPHAQAPGGEASRVFVSQLWLLRFRHLLEPGPVDHAPFFCRHGAVHVPPSARCKLCAIPIAAWQELAERYGGGAEIGELRECDECVREEEVLDKRREAEQSTVHQYDKTYIDPGQAWHIIDRHWLQSWIDFVSEDARGAPPGPISNDSLLQSDGVTPLPGLEKGVAYRGVNAQVWGFFASIYGGGPAIRRQRLDIYSPSMPAPGEPWPDNATTDADAAPGQRRAAAPPMRAASPAALAAPAAVGRYRQASPP